MKLLVDTHILLWAAGSPERLSRKTRGLLNDPDTTLVFSVVSLWEIAIKHSLGRPEFQVDPSALRRQLVDNGYVELPVLGTHALAVGSLPSLHKDPFDRMLLAQSSVEGMALLTRDDRLLQYSGNVRRA